MQKSVLQTLLTVFLFLLMLLPDGVHGNTISTAASEAAALSCPGSVTVIPTTCSYVSNGNTITYSCIIVNGNNLPPNVREILIPPGLYGSARFFNLQGDATCNVVNLRAQRTFR